MRRHHTGNKLLTILSISVIFLYCYQIHSILLWVEGTIIDSLLKCNTQTHSRILRQGTPKWMSSYHEYMFLILILMAHHSLALVTKFTR